MDMDFRCLSILFSLNLILMTAHATLPPQIYWEMMLPSTPMPKTIVELLNHGGSFSTGHMEKATNDYQKARIIDLEKSFDMQLEDEFPMTWYGAQKWGKSFDKQLEDDFPATWYGAKKWEKSIDKQLEDDFPVTWYGTKKWGKSIDKQLEDEFPVSWYGPKKGLSQDIIPSSYTYHKKSKPSPKTLSHNDANLHDHPKGDLIFTVEGLHPGSKLDAHFYKREIKAPLLPRQVAQRIPFSSKKMKEILDIFSVQPGSEIAKVVAKNIQRCEVPLSNGEEKHCATSLESMVDFITSRLGNKNVLAISTEVERETRSRKFIVKDGVKNLAYENVIACHPMNYPPHVVFFCHHLLNTTTHFVPLVGEEDGVGVKAVAICHRDTSTWDPNHVAFQVLKIKPGDAPVCHILPLRHFMFTK